MMSDIFGKASIDVRATGWNLTCSQVSLHPQGAQLFRWVTRIRPYLLELDAPT